MSTSIVYWDSDCILGWLKNEPDKNQLCEGTLDAAEKGKIKIGVSALSLVEVLRVKGHKKLTANNEKKIRRFFDNDYFVLYDVDQWIGEKARDLVWQYNVEPKDAIHTATAVLNNISTLNTFDNKLLGLDNSIPLDDSSSNLRICKPDINPQCDIKFGSDKQAKHQSEKS